MNAGQTRRELHLGYPVDQPAQTLVGADRNPVFFCEARDTPQYRGTSVDRRPGSGAKADRHVLRARARANATSTAR